MCDPNTPCGPPSCEIDVVRASRPAALCPQVCSRRERSSSSEWKKGARQHVALARTSPRLAHARHPSPSEMERGYPHAAASSTIPLSTGVERGRGGEVPPQKALCY